MTLVDERCDVIYIYIYIYIYILYIALVLDTVLRVMLVDERCGVVYSSSPWDSTEGDVG